MLAGENADDVRPNCVKADIAEVEKSGQTDHNVQSECDKNVDHHLVGNDALEAGAGRIDEPSENGNFGPPRHQIQREDEERNE